MPADAASSAPTVRLSVVVPAYGDAHRVGDTVRRLRHDLSDVAAHGGLEVVIVDDGSPDDTAARAHDAGADQVISLPQNRGKGAAVRTGVLAARGETIVFTDVDLSYAPVQILRLLREVEIGGEMVVGSRLHAEAEAVVSPGAARRVASRLFNILALLAIGEYRDTQCGLKAFRHDVARRLFSRSTIDGFAFDVELFQLARRLGVHVDEVPVSLTSADTSSVRLRGEVKALRDLVRIALGRRRDLGD